MVIVIYRPAELVAQVGRDPVLCRLRPEHRIHLLALGHPRRIALSGPQGCAVWAQPQPSRDPPGSLRQTRVPTRACMSIHTACQNMRLARFVDSWDAGRIE